jgi:hypothetical protein
MRLGNQARAQKATALNVMLSGSHVQTAVPLQRQLVFASALDFAGLPRLDDHEAIRTFGYRCRPLAGQRPTKSCVVLPDTMHQSVGSLGVHNWAIF